MDLDQVSKSQMRDFLNRPHSFNDDLKYNLRLSTGISIGMFLFYLFFQPLDLKNADFDNKLVIIAGFGFITFGILGINLILLPFAFSRFFQTGKWNLLRDILFNGLIWILISTAYTFYARYVGLIEITYHSMLRLLLLGLAPVAILVVVNQNKILKRYLQNALDLTKKADSVSENLNDEEFEIQSEIKSERIRLKPKQLVLVKSANNYVEVFWQHGEEIRKRLIRTTLTKLEMQLRQYPVFIRCHRTALINKLYIESIKKSTQGLQIRMKGINEVIHVSRKYALKVKENMSTSSFSVVSGE